MRENTGGEKAAARAVNFVQAVLFDLDGTLADTMTTIASAVNASLEAMGEIPRPLEDYPLMVGDGLPALCRRALAASALDSSAADAANESTEPTRERIDELRQRVMRYYDDHLLEGTRLYPGVAELLGGLLDDGIALAVLSNKPHALTKRVVEALIPDGTFRVVWGHREDIPRKPDPGGALHAAAEMGVDPGACLFVGDSGVDMQTARAAGMTAVGVLWGFRGEEELVRDGAAHIVSEAKEIAALVRGPERR